MENDMEIKDKKIICSICGGESIYYFSKNKYDLFKCPDCRLIFVSPVPSSIDVYNKEYFSGAGGGFGYVNYDLDKEPMVPVFAKYLELLTKLGKSKGSLLDVGAATGFFLKMARERGYQTSGVEMSQYASEMAQKQGLKVLVGDLVSARLVSESLDVVTMLDVLEHMKDPFKDLMEAKRILKKDGLLVINTPNGQSLLSKVLKANWHLVLPPEHLYYFSPENLSMYLEAKGFKKIYCGNIGKRFTLQYIFIMLYKWQKIKLWKHLSDIFSKGLLSKLYIPINLYDNFFIIFKKAE